MMRMTFLILTFLSINVFADNFNTKVQLIETLDIPQQYKKVSFNKIYTVALPRSVKVEQFGDSGRLYGVRDQNGKGMVMINETLASNTIFLNTPSYGLKNYSRRQLLSAIFNPQHVSNNEVNETRKLIFKELKNVAIYKRDDFIFFREDFKKEGKIKTSFRVSAPNDKVLRLNFLVNDEKLIMNFIRSLNVAD